mgnify:CR=1 FL=1
MSRLLGSSIVTSPYRLALDMVVLALGATSVWRMIVLDGRPNWTAFSVLLLLACIGTRMRLHLPGLENSISLWFPFGFAAILEQPPWAAFVVLSTAGIFDRINPGRALRASQSAAAIEALYFVASTALATLAATSARKS